MFTWLTLPRPQTPPPLAWVPIGSFEQHGPLLPLATDTLIATGLAEDAQRQLGGLILPPVPIGCSQEHRTFPGTVSVPAALLDAWVSTLIRDLWRQGIPRVILVNAHGGNYVLQHTVQECMTAAAPTQAVLLVPQRPHWDAALRRADIPWSLHDDMHAGAIETSLLMARFPDCHLTPPPPAADHQAPDRPYFLTWGLAYYSATGILGTPSEASADRGRALWAALVDVVVEASRRFLQETMSP